MSILHRRSLLAGTALVLAAPAIVRAQSVGDWPKGPVKIIVPSRRAARPIRWRASSRPS